MRSLSYGWKSLSARRLKSGVAAAALLLSLGIVASATQVGSDSTKKTEQHKTKHWYEVGKASWYGSRFQGHKTAGGETFDMNALTCAHRNLPLGSWVRVTNLKNRRSVFVRVNDRGPVPDDRIVDLSYAAARAVGLAGVGKVRLEMVHYGDADLAKALVAQMQMPVIPGQ